MKKNLPVLNIGDFVHVNSDRSFYTERILPHIRQHDITKKPHRHDFFMVALFTQGHGTHEIDFTRYSVNPGSVFFLSPGQSHHWTLSADADGLIFFHTRDFFDEGFVNQKLRDFPFFNSGFNPPLCRLKRGPLTEIACLFNEIKTEYDGAGQLKDAKLRCLVNLLYIALTRVYEPGEEQRRSGYVTKLRLFEDLVEKHFRETKFPSAYAEMLNITERHLNRICRMGVNKTSSDIIQDRLILEAKRLLMHEQVPVWEVAAKLGFMDNSYFSRIFKKRTGQTPKEFRAVY